MKYYRWTTQEMANLVLGPRISAVCSSILRDQCLRKGKGCISVLRRDNLSFDGATDEERASNKEQAAKEAQAKCRKIQVVITNV